ncbi:hypothetical protein ACQCU1_12980 [Sutcliffiella horikoshii]|uniref:hypothetical protein n=1 Tax=Sutcliffiella horikoshii TaxID=79883 RepID=UPI003CF1D6B4
MRKNIIKSIYFISILLLIVGCSQKPTINVAKVEANVENHLNELDEVEIALSTFDGDENIKFRLMVEGYPTENEVTILFNKILESFEKYSNQENFWMDYNGYFDIKNYEDGVIYEGTKLIDREIKIISK